jgi:tRNA 5-methylaminomethyl-2-thiouridine biosynthesis bifunctional protein
LLENGRIMLTLVIGDIDANLPQVNGYINAFILDADHAGKAARALSRLAVQDAVLICRRFSDTAQQALQQAGFVFDASDDCADNKSLMCCARFAPRWQPPIHSVPPIRKAVIIGAGLAGSAACERLAARGWQLVLIERHNEPAQEASGNRAGIFMPLLAKDDNATARLTRAAYLFALQLWRQLGDIGHAFSGETCGVLQLTRDEVHALTLQETIRRWQYPAGFAQWLDAAEAAALLKQSVPNGGCFFPQGGWANAASICRALLAACGGQLETHYAHSVLRLERDNNQWQVWNANGVLIAQAPIVILANGIGALAFSQTEHLPLISVRGQVTDVAADALPDLPVVVCGDGYLTRPSQGMRSIGASYDADQEAEPRHSSDLENWTRLQRMLPDISVKLEDVAYRSRVAFRCVSADRLPLVGAIPDASESFRGDRLRDVPRLPGLYGLLGYASRGLIWSSLGAELVTAQLEGEPLPIERELAEALDPARFLLKAHRKNSGQ